LPVILSSNLTPTAIIRSVSIKARLAYFVPCIPAMPSESLFVSGKEPIPIRVFITGIPAPSAKLVSISLPPEEITPPPANITGFFDSAIFFTASLTCLRLPFIVGL